MDTPEDTEWAHRVVKFINSQQISFGKGKLDQDKIDTLRDALGVDLDPAQTEWLKVFEDTIHSLDGGDVDSLPDEYKPWVEEQLELVRKGSLRVDNYCRLRDAGFDMRKCLPNGWRNSALSAMLMFERCGEIPPTGIGDKTAREISRWSKTQEDMIDIASNKVQAVLRIDMLKKAGLFAGTMFPWEAWFSSVESLVISHGHIPSIHSPDPQTRIKGEWVLWQTNLYAHSCLTVEQIERLDSIGIHVSGSSPSLPWSQTSRLMRTVRKIISNDQSELDTLRNAIVPVLVYCIGINRADLKQITLGEVKNAVTKIRKNAILFKLSRMAVRRYLDVRKVTTGVAVRNSDMILHSDTSDGLGLKDIENWFRIICKEARIFYPGINLDVLLESHKIRVRRR